MRPSIKFIKETMGDKELIGIEVGVSEGTHAKLLINQLKFKQLILTDVWENIPSNIPYNGNFPRYGMEVEAHFKDYPNVTTIKGYSVDVAQQFEDEYFDFVYLDAGHEYEDIAADIDAWYRKVKKGGVLAGHDYHNTDPNYPGLDRAVDDYFSAKKFCADVDNKDYTNSDWWVIKEDK